jgi:peptidoglycan-N-acetylglucosamine deacetylase
VPAHAPRFLKTILVPFLLLLAAVAGLWKLSEARSFQAFGELVHRVETTQPLVALTFDDGPTPAAAQAILALLEQEGVRATFFFTGAEMAAQPGLAARFVQAGHELGNHSYTHARMVLKSPGFVRDELDRTDALIRQAGQAGPIFFRPPYGRKLLVLPWVLARSGRTSVTWDVEPESFPEVDGNAQRIQAHVLERAKPGSIILLHVMYPSRAESLLAVQGTIRGLKARGFRLVTVSELLRAAG